MNQPTPQYIFHLLPNAHLDPVWLWDWREGLNEGLTTVKSVLDLMDEFPELTFIRGESCIYQHIEKTDPATFDRLGAMILSKRWDIVGGTYNQPDTNLASTETLCRQFERGLGYFQSRFGTTPRIAFQADSFGHSPGLPNILHAFGMTGFAFTRPARSEFPMPEPVFRWEGDSPSRAILCYRPHYHAYCSERGNLNDKLNFTLREAEKLPFRNIGVLFGLGNHGGGPSRRHIEDARTWAAAQPHVQLRFSTLHGFFESLETEIRENHGAILPTVRGDLGFCLRGCYSSVMKLKSAYRRAESLLGGAETTQSIITSSLQQNPGRNLDEAWEGILFNSFHDILPGSCIERAVEEQISWIGLSAQHAREATFQALNQLAQAVDITVEKPETDDRPTDVPVLVWNPLPRPYSGWVELEVGLDYRPLWGIDSSLGSLPLSLTGPNGEKPRFQEIARENRSMCDVAWRKRVLAYVEIPSLGWKVFRLGFRNQAPSVDRGDTPPCIGKKGPVSFIQNQLWKVEVDAEKQLQLSFQGKPFPGNRGRLEIVTTEDPWGSWGGMKEETDSLHSDVLRENWVVCDSEVLEEGPERCSLWTLWKAGNSRLNLTFQVAADAREIRVQGRMLLNERSARVKLLLPASGAMEMQVPGSRVKRGQPGHLPCGRWFRLGLGDDSPGFVSDVLSDLRKTPHAVEITLARASRYADDVETSATEVRWQPSVDCGELKFEFWLTQGGLNLEQLSQELLNPPMVLPTSAHPGTLQDSGTFAAAEPASLSILSLQRTGKKALRLRVQNQSEHWAEGTFRMGAQNHPLGLLAPYQIKNVTVESRPKKRPPRARVLRLRQKRQGEN